jgi:hypothetical protein
MSKGAIYVEGSSNRKILGSKKVDATYASIQTSCPKDCPLKGEGCYAELGYVGITSHRLDDEAEGTSPLAVARAEASAIDNSYKGGKVPDKRDMRLHVAGDSRTIAGTKLLNNAIGRWKKRGGGDCWSYTHAWRKVPRIQWKNVSILASISNTSEIEDARLQGYAPAIVVPEHPSEKAYALPGSTTKFIPCPNQTRGIGCTDCRLCFNANRLFDSNMGIAFAVHGVMKEKMKRHLNVVK